jgi:hypothetical protein
MARQLIEKYVFTPGGPNLGKVKFPGKCDLNQLLIISNKTEQVNIYALGDPTRGGSVFYDPDDESFFSEQQGATTVTLQYNTSEMTTLDELAIYTDAPKHIGNIIRPYFFGVDAIERMRVSQPESLIDADFEYGLQPTKWQNYSDIRNIPAIFEKTGLDLPIIDVITNGQSPSLITVVCDEPHGVQPNDPILMYGLSNSASSARAEGTFIVHTTPSATSFTYFAKGVVGANNDSLYTASTYCRIGGFYTNSDIPTTSIESNQASPSVITITTPHPHGIIPGMPIALIVSSSGTNHSLCNGIFFVESVPTPTTFKFTARVGGAVASAGLTGKVYIRADSYVVHRPFDGGVQLGAFNPTHGAMASRQSKKYFRYQSGKGVLWTSGIALNPVLNLDQISANGTAAGSIITVETELDHGLQIGATVEIYGVVTEGYNGSYGVSSIVNENTFRVIASSELGSEDAVITSRPRVVVKNWHGSSVRVGPFDSQNGLFWEFDGKTLFVVRRSSTYQLSGFVSVVEGSQLVSGSRCRFTQQLRQGDNIVIRGMTYKVVNIQDDNNMSVVPAFRGKSSDFVKLAVTIDTKVPQSEFNYDRVDGTGASGYKVNLNKMQMFGISFSWYGAGFIDFMLRGSDGNMMMVHRMKSNNVNDEAFMRSGNIPVRYETINESVIGSLAEDISDTQTFIPLVDATGFPEEGGLVYIDNEIISYTGISGNNLTGCTRASPSTYFVGGSVRTFTAGPAQEHFYVNGNTSVILLSNTASPILSHWGSSYIMDGGFNIDRGYYFNYPELDLSLPPGESKTAFFIRLAPSVSNSITGSLGERDLVSHAQILLQKLQYQSDQALQIYGILNPSNIQAKDLTWKAINQLSLGSQPSFAEVSDSDTTVAIPGEQIFSALGQVGLAELDLSSLKELSNSVIGGNNTYPDGPDCLAIVVKNLNSTTAATVNLNLFWSEQQA